MKMPLYNKMYKGIFLWLGGGLVRGHPMIRVEPLARGIMQITFDTGNFVVVDMKPCFKGFRFGVLRELEVWESADTDGTFVHWYKNGIAVAELAYDEIMKMTLGESY